MVSLEQPHLLLHAKLLLPHLLLEPLDLLGQVALHCAPVPPQLTQLSLQSLNPLLELQLLSPDQLQLLAQLTNALIFLRYITIELLYLLGQFLNLALKAYYLLLVHLLEVPVGVLHLPYLPSQPLLQLLYPSLIL